jgi:thiol-disulfide isomerase/thioredoxin
VSARTLAVFLAVLAVIGLLSYGLVAKDEGSLAVGDEVPSAELEALEPGGPGSLADLRGKWVLVNVWASWCGPCRDEAPALQRFYERHRAKDFEILGIDTQETSIDGQGFVDDYGLTYPQLHDGDGEYADDLKTKGVPENFLVDPDGNLAYLQPGPVNEEILDKQIAPMIAAS